MATEGSNGAAPNPNHDDGVNATEDTPPSEDEHHNQEPTNYEVQTSAASSENFIVPASAVERAPNTLKCRCMPHGVYVFVPALLSMFAWFAHLSKNGCDYSSVAGPIVADITNNPLVPYIHVGLSHYREPTYNKDDGEWYVDETLPCQAYNTDVVDIDGVWTFAKITSFLSFVFGGGGALFICFSSCFVFRKETWRWAGYEMLMATISASFGSWNCCWFGCVYSLCLICLDGILPTADAMSRLCLSIFAVIALMARGNEDVDFQDTPLLTSLWEAANSGNNDALDRLLDSSPTALKLRSSDGRGLAWWGFEFQNIYALGAVIAYGGDIVSEEEDLQGQTAVTMCTENSECNKDSVIEKAKELSADILKRKEERAKAAEAEDADIDDDDAADDEF